MNHPSIFVKFRKIYSIIALIFFTCCGTSGQDNSQSARLILPSGFTSEIIAEKLGRARHMAISTNGDIYVSLERLKDGKGIVAMRDNNKDGKIDETKYFGTFNGTGIRIYNGYVYFGSDTIVVRYKLKSGELLPDENYEIIAKGFYKGRQHASKPFTFDGKGNMYVNVGVPSNACQQPDRSPATPGQDPCPLLETYGGIWRFDANKLDQDLLKNGYRYATGLRNCVALSWNFQANELYALMHGRDQLGQLWPDIYSEDDGVNLPAEEFFLLKEGADGGWPYCYYDPIKNKKMLAPEYGGDGKKEGQCTGKTNPIMAFPAHYAPNDVLFYTSDQFPEKYRNGAFIAFHGSWNRAPQEQKGFNVVFVPFKGNQPSGNWEVFADGFAGIPVIKSPRDAKYRPCGLAQGADGALYVVEDREGTIWRITYKK